jgi:hypothetical protein
MFNLRNIIVLTVMLFAVAGVSAQENTSSKEQKTEQVIVGAEMRIPANSKIYVNPMEGFETYVVAALQKKKIPVIVVASRELADFEIKGSVEKQKAGWAKTIFISPLPSIDATMQVVNIKTGVVAFSNSSTKNNAARGRKGSAEHLAKNLARKMQLDGDMKKD